MTQYIDKDAVVQYLTGMAYAVCCDKNTERIIRKFIIPHINTLEVKEVDFDAEWKRYFEHRGEMATVNVKHLAKHFFELGMLSTITEEDCKLIWNIGDGLPCMKEEDFFKELLRRYKAQKGE